MAVIMAQAINVAGGAERSEHARRSRVIQGGR